MLRAVQKTFLVFGRVTGGAVSDAERGTRSEVAKNPLSRAGQVVSLSYA